jgi:hypothetical protein
MASAEYYRNQAQVFASMARAADNRAMADLYDGMALEYLAKAEEIEPSAPAPPAHVVDGEANTAAWRVRSLLTAEPNPRRALRPTAAKPAMR